MDNMEKKKETWERVRKEIGKISEGWEISIDGLNYDLLNVYFRKDYKDGFWMYEVNANIIFGSKAEEINLGVSILIGDKYEARLIAEKVKPNQIGKVLNNIEKLEDSSRKFIKEVFKNG